MGLARSLAVALATASATGGLEQIVKVLNDLIKKNEELTKTHTKTWAERKCEGDQKLADGESSLEDNTNIRNAREALIEELMADNKVQSQKIATAMDEIQQAKNDKKKATATRKANNDDFEDYKTTSKKNQKTLKSAIDKVSATNKAGVKKSHDEFMNGGKAVSMLSEVRKQLSTVVAISSAMAGKMEKVDSLLQTKGDSYGTESSEVLAIMTQLLTTMDQDLEIRQNTEDAQLKAFNALKTSLDDAIDVSDAAQKAAEKKLGENVKSLTTARTELTNAINAIKAANFQIETATVNLKNHEEQFNTQMEFLAEEAAAASEALNILDSDEMFASNEVASSAKSKLTNFLQLPSGKAEVIEQMRNLAHETHSLEIAFLTNRMRKYDFGNDAVASLIGEVDALIKSLNDQQDQDRDDRKECIDRRKDLNDRVKGHGQTITKLNSTILAQTGKLGDLDNYLQKTKEDLDKRIRNLAKEAEERQTDYSDFVTESTNTQFTIEAVDKAVARLKQFYEDKKYTENTAATDVKKSYDMDAKETKAQEKAFEGASKKGNKVIKLLTTLGEELNTTLEDLIKSEATNQNEFNKETSKGEDLNRKSALQIEMMNSKQATITNNRQQKRGSKKEQETLQQAAEDELEGLKPGCDFITQHYEERKTNRKKEVKGLKNAKDALKKIGE